MLNNVNDEHNEKNRIIHKSVLIMCIFTVLVVPLLIGGSSAFAANSYGITTTDFTSDDTPTQAEIDTFVSNQETAGRYHWAIYNKDNGDGTTTGVLMITSSPIIEDTNSNSVKSQDGSVIYYILGSGSAENSTSQFTPLSDYTLVTSGEHSPTQQTGGEEDMFSNLTTTNITTEATNWVGNFNDILLVVVGLGIAFASVRFVKSLFF
jgi:hypothetical protein